MPVKKSAPAARVRLDLLLVEKQLVASRELARRMIMAGEVLVEETPVIKPAQLVASNAVIRLRERQRFVSRGGDKLEGALKAFGLSVEGRVCADVGASTGGFTDCLLQHGAERVYAIDVGYGQLAWKLRDDPRVVVMERTNARYLEALPEPVSLVVADASFISLRLLIPVMLKWLTPDAELLLLVKPQFEAGRGDVGKGGVVRDPEIHRRVLIGVIDYAQEQGCILRGLAPSPLRGPAGNIEFLLYLGQGAESGGRDQLLTSIAQAVDAAQLGPPADGESG